MQLSTKLIVYAATRVYVGHVRLSLLGSRLSVYIQCSIFVFFLKYSNIVVLLVGLV